MADDYGSGYGTDDEPDSADEAYGKDPYLSPGDIQGEEDPKPELDDTYNPEGVEEEEGFPDDIGRGQIVFGYVPKEEMKPQKKMAEIKPEERKRKMAAAKTKARETKPEAAKRTKSGCKEDEEEGEEGEGWDDEGYSTGGNDRKIRRRVGKGYSTGGNDRKSRRV